jgi:hypothetical protein
MPTSHVLWTGQPLAYPAVQKSGAAAIVQNDLLVTLAFTKAIELEFIKSIVINKGAIEAQQLTNLQRYRNWLQDLWKQLCGNAINIVEEKNSCTIEGGLQEIKPVFASK